MNPASPATDIPSILIVDDTPANLRLLTEMLKEHGYRARPVPNGRLALQAAQSDRPDLILLDISMPEMDGYEVCQHLKSDPYLSSIPVIFISALNETIDKVKAFGVGGVDYITKPFQFEEVEARVGTHLELRRFQIELERQNSKLKENYEKLRRLEALRDSLTHMVIHDLRSPLTGLGMTLELLRLDAPDGSEMNQLLEQATQTTALLNDMVSQVLDVSRMESGQMPLEKASHDLLSLAEKAMSSMAGLSKDHCVGLSAPGPARVLCDGDVIRRVLGNLLGNALKFSSRKSEVQITITSRDRTALVAVRDNGPGIPREFHDKIFEKFGQVEGKSKKLGTGLGLTFCKLAIEAHGGEVGLRSEIGKGSIFWFTLPLDPAGGLSK